MVPAASVHVPAQHLESENCSGPEIPIKEDPLWPARVWDSDWPKPGYTYLTRVGPLGPSQVLFAGSREAGGILLPLLCLPTTAPAPASLSLRLASGVM